MLKFYFFNMIIQQSIFYLTFLYCLQVFTSTLHLNMSCETGMTSEPLEIIHFRDVSSSVDGFVAAGSDGCLYKISNSGETERLTCASHIALNCVLVIDKHVIVGGDNGVLIRYDGLNDLQHLNSNTKNHINTLVWFKGEIIAGADDGELITGDMSGSFTVEPLDLKGDIVSLSCSDTRCFGVTSEGEIIETKDGQNREIFDFNAYYKGFYQPSSFTAIEVTENKIAVIGVHPDGSPAVYSSNRGKVWTEKPLVYYDNHGGLAYLYDKPNDILYDKQYDRFILLCDRGGLMTIPSCSQCNKYFELSSENFQAGEINGCTLVMVGKQGFVKIITLGLL